MIEKVLLLVFVLFSNVFGGPNRFREVREVERNNFHPISCKLDLMV